MERSGVSAARTIPGPAWYCGTTSEKADVFDTRMVKTLGGRERHADAATGRADGGPGRDQGHGGQWRSGTRPCLPSVRGQRRHSRRNVATRSMADRRSGACWPALCHDQARYTELDRGGDRAGDIQCVATFASCASSRPVALLPLAVKSALATLGSPAACGDRKAARFRQRQPAQRRIRPRPANVTAA